jgi:2-methylcitrate dehydratase
MSPDQILPRLARLVLAEPALTPAVARAARVLLLDSAACAVAALGHEAVSKAGVAAQALFAGNAARGLGNGAWLGVAGAVLDSGAAIRALDFNDFYWGPGIGGHPSDLVALALAVGEGHGRSLGEVLQAVVVGYEVYLRLLDLLAPDGLYDHTSAMTLAGAALAGRLLRLDEAAMTHALAMAAVRGPAWLALRYGEISEAKAVAPAAAALSGLVAAQLAAAGMTGPVAAACGPRGLQALVRPGAELASLAEWRDVLGDDANGRPQRMLRVGIKRYPCIGTAQAAVAAAVDLSGQVASNGRRIERVDVRLSDLDLVRHQTSDVYRRPARRETADHSFFSLLAMALADGDLTPAQFAARRWADADVRALSDRLHFTCDLPGAADGVFAARLVATLDDGRRLDAALDHPPGHPQRPLDDAGIAAKFRGCVRGRLGDTHADIDIDTDAAIGLALRGDITLPVAAFIDLLLPKKD